MTEDEKKTREWVRDNPEEAAEFLRLGKEKDREKGKIVFAVFDTGGQGMADNGLLGIFTTEKKAEKAVGDDWYDIKPIELNYLNKEGV